MHQEFVAIESTLVDAVEGLSVSDTRRLLDYWRQSVDGPGTVADEVRQDRARGVSLSLTMDGMARIDGWLTTTAGEALATALDSLMPPPSPDDPRQPRQRRHDALEDLAREFLDHDETPVVGGEKPHINLVCDLGALKVSREAFTKPKPVRWSPSRRYAGSHATPRWPGSCSTLAQKS